MGTSAYLDVNSFARQTTWAHGFMAAYALWGGLVVLALLVVGSWWILARRALSPARAVATVFCAGLGALVALGTNQVISKAVAEARPCHALHHVEVLLSCAADYSFPSDHAMIAGGLVAGILFLNRKVGAVALVVALLLAFARVYAGVHYPGDVVAGLLIGAAISVAIMVVLRPLATRVAVAVEGTRLRPLVNAH